MRVLGWSDCEECGCERCRRLVVNPRGVFSRCWNCGFTEWEWSPGNGLEYLKYLAEKYGIPHKDLVEAVRDECSTQG